MEHYLKMFKNDSFSLSVSKMIYDSRKVLSKKGKEYATTKDRFHNFKQASILLNTSKEKVLFGMQIKHIISIIDMFKSKTIYDYKIIDEKIGDAYNYFILLLNINKNLLELVYPNFQLTKEIKKLNSNNLKNFNLLEDFKCAYKLVIIDITEDNIKKCIFYLYIFNWFLYQRYYGGIMIEFNKIPEQGWKLHTILPWGKYKGSTIEEIGEIDVSYLKWLTGLENVKLHSEVLGYMKIQNYYNERSDEQYDGLPF